METFTKLFASITDSSIWSEDNETRIVWITMLAMCDQDGYVPASIPGLAARARVSVEAVERAIAKFTAPDKYSRSEEFEGRRIEKADRGWLILNYHRFKDMRDEEARRRYERDRKRRQRERGRDTTNDVRDRPGHGGTVPECHALSAHVDADTEKEKPPPPRTSYVVSGDVPDSPPDGGGGGGGGSLRGDPQGAPPPAPPAGEAKAPAVDGQEIERRAAHERQVYDALIAAGIADPGTRVRLAALPHVTAAVVRCAAREAKASGKGPGVVVSIIETASARMDLEAAALKNPVASGAGSSPPDSPQVARTTAETNRVHEEFRRTRGEWVWLTDALRQLGADRLEAAKQAVLEAQPALRRALERESVLGNRMLMSLVADHLGVQPDSPPSAQCQVPASQREAVTA